MFRGVSSFNGTERLRGTSEAARRSCWRTLTSLRDDSMAGPGPSSLAAASATLASLAIDRGRFSAGSAAGSLLVSETCGATRVAQRNTYVRLTPSSTPPSAVREGPISISDAEELQNQPGKHGSKRKQRGARSRRTSGGSKEAECLSSGQQEASGPSGIREADDNPNLDDGEQRPVAAVESREPPMSTAAVDSQPTSHVNRPVRSILDIASADGGTRARSRSSVTSAAIADEDGAGTAEDCMNGAVVTDGGDGTGLAFPIRLPDGRQLVKVVEDTPSAAAASALSHALGMEQRAVIRFDGGAGALKGLRTLTLANMFMGGYQRALSFVVDVKQVTHGKPSPLDGRPQSGDVSFMYRVMAKARSLEPYDKQLPVAMRRARFLLDLSINVRQAWDMKGDVDEEQAYDLADTLYGALLAQQSEEDAEQLRRQQPQENCRPNIGQGFSDVINLAHADHDLLQRLPTGDSSHLERGPGPRRQWQQHQRNWEHERQRRQGDLPTPCIIVTADLGQGPTMLTALGLLQKRLREERQKAVVETTLYRASVAAPRLNAKDGWVYVIGLGFEKPYLPLHAARHAQKRQPRQQPSSVTTKNSALGKPSETPSKLRRRGGCQGWTPALRSPSAAAAAAAGIAVAEPTSAGV